MAPIDTSSDAVNVLAQTSHLQLLASGGDNGVVQCWDLRSNKLAGELNVAACVTEAAGSEITALTFAPGSGMSLTVGTSNGVVAAFDLRSTAPKLVKEHQCVVQLRLRHTHTHLRVCTCVFPVHAHACPTRSRRVLLPFGDARVRVCMPSRVALSLCGSLGMATPLCAFATTRHQAT